MSGALGIELVTRFLKERDCDDSFDPQHAAAGRGLVAGSHDYATAFKETEETGRPLVVLIGADWCPGCRQMKYTTIPELEKKGGLRKVAFAYVNTDHQGELGWQVDAGRFDSAVGPVSQDRRRLDSQAAYRRPKHEQRRGVPGRRHRRRPTAKLSRRQ